MLLDNPQIVEGSQIINLVVPSAPSGNPDPGEMYFSSSDTQSGTLFIYDPNFGGVGVGGFGSLAVSGDGTLTSHVGDFTLHLTSAQNTFLDGLNLPSLTATEVNYVHGVTSPIQTQLNTLTSHTTDYTLHLTSSQNTLLDGITVTFTDINSIPTLTSNLSTLTSSFNTHIADTALHLTSAQNTFLDALNLPTLTAASVNALPAHLTDFTMHLTSAQNTFLDAITVGSVDVNSLTGIDTYLTSIGSASIASSFATLFSTKLDKSGGTMTGNIVMSNSSKITGLPLPTLDTDAASKAYVDALAGGIDWKQAVKAATTANISLNNTQTIDGVAVTTGDRVLVKDQTTSSQNGIYVVDINAWTRATDYDSALEISQSAVYVLAGGTTNGRGSFVQTSNITTVGTDAIVFTPFSGPVVNSAGNGINLAVGGTVSVKEGAGITFDGSSNVVVDLFTGGGLMTTADGTNSSTATAAQLSLTKTGSAGTYKSVTTDAYGRVTAGTNPTTIAGFGITDAVLKTGDTMSGALSVPALNGQASGLFLTAVGATPIVFTVNGAESARISQTAVSFLSTPVTTGNTQTFDIANNSSNAGNTTITIGNNNLSNTNTTTNINGIVNIGIAGLTVNTTQSAGTALTIQSGQTNGFWSHVAFKDSTTVRGYVGMDSTGTGNFVISQNMALPMTFFTNGVERMRVDATGNVVIGTGALGTNSINGFLYLTTMSGAPSGTPTGYTGRSPIVLNTSNNQLYFYSGSAWASVGAGSAAFTSISGLPTRTTWNSVSGAYGMTIGQLAWKNGGNGYSIFDASAGTSPDATSVSNTNATNPWIATYPTLMGWDGTSTYGVRVDSARLADNTSSVSSAAGGTYTWSGVNSFRSNSNTGAQGINTNPTGMHAYSDNSSGAIMSFYRNGLYGLNMGLDSDNVFRIGGWNAPANLLQLDMTGVLTVPVIKASGYTYNGATYSSGYSAYLTNTDAAAGKRLLLTIPAGAFNAEVRVSTSRSTNDGSSNSRARWAFKIVRGGGNTGSFAFFNVESAEEDFNIGSYQWYFDTVTGNAYLRFGQAGNSFQWNVETVFSVDVTTVTPTLTTDAGTAPSGTAYNPSRIISSSNVAGSNVLALGTNGAERARFDSAGNMLIGLTSTSGYGLLQVSSPASQTGNIADLASAAYSGQAQVRVRNTFATGAPAYTIMQNANTGYGASSGFAVGIDTTGNAVVAQNSNLPLSFWTNATERMRIDNAGNVSIGGITPVETLTVGSANNSTDITLGLRTKTSASAVTRTLVTQGSNTGSITINWDVGSAGSEGALILKGGTTERLRIASTGKITSTSAVAGDVLALLQNTSGTGNGVRIDGGSNSSTYALSIRNGSGTELMQVNGAGAVAINATPVTNTKFFVNGTVAQNVTAVAATEIDWSAGNYHTKTISGATTFTFSNLPASGFAMITLKLTNGGSAAITWPTIKWSGGAAPTLTAAGIDIINLFTDDGGTTVYGILAGKGMA